MFLFSLGRHVYNIVWVCYLEVGECKLRRVIVESLSTRLVIQHVKIQGTAPAISWGDISLSKPHIYGCSYRSSGEQKSVSPVTEL